MNVVFEEILTDEQLAFYAECAKIEGKNFCQWLQEMFAGEF